MMPMKSSHWTYWFCITVKRFCQNLQHAVWKQAWLIGIIWTYDALCYYWKDKEKQATLLGSAASLTSHLLLPNPLWPLEHWTPKQESKHTFTEPWKENLDAPAVNIRGQRPWKAQREIAGTWRLWTWLWGNLRRKSQSSQRGMGRLNTCETECCLRGHTSNNVSPVN